MMSVGKKTMQYTVAAAIVAIAIIGASFAYIGFPSVLTTSGTNSTTSGSSIGGPTSTLLIQLTDPPQVPALTTSLNLTYSSIGILAAEPTSTPGKVNTTTITITPQGGNATVDLLKLQNLSQTLATASLPNDSVIYSVTFAVSHISIDVNGTVSPVSFASGNSSLVVTIANPSSITGTNVALLQLNPVVVDTASGYQMIPSAVGVIQHDHGQGESEIGSQHKLTNEDFGNLSRASGNATVDFAALSVNGNQTALTVLVNNTGGVPIVINGIGIHGNFSVASAACQSGSQNGNNSQSGDKGSNNPQGDGVVPFDSGNRGNPSPFQQCGPQDHPDQLVFVPTSVNSTSGTSCIVGNMTLVNGPVPFERMKPLVLNPGQCIQLSFSGVLSFGESNQVLTPSTLSGQAYGVALIASNGANQQISCVLPLGTATSCVPMPPQRDGGD